MLSRRSFALSGLAAFTAACKKKRSPGFDGYVYVANEAGNAIAVVDLTAFAVARHIALDDSPSAVIAHPSKPRVYSLAPKSGTIYEIDTEKFAVARQVKLGPSLGMRWLNGSLWVLARRTLTRVPVDTMRPAEPLSLPHDAIDFDVSDNTNNTSLACVSYGPAGSLSVCDLKTGKAGAAAKVSDELGVVRFRQDGEGLLVADKAARQICVMDVARDSSPIYRLPSVPIICASRMTAVSYSLPVKVGMRSWSSSRTTCLRSPRRFSQDMPRPQWRRPRPICSLRIRRPAM